MCPEDQDREFVLINLKQSSNVLNVHRPHSIQSPQLSAGRTISIRGPQFAHPWDKPKMVVSSLTPFQY